MRRAEAIDKEGRGRDRRRGHNEGSIYQRKDGRWVGAVTESNGTRKYYYGKTSAEVRARVLEARSNLQKGLPISMEVVVQPLAELTLGADGVDGHE